MTVWSSTLLSAHRSRIGSSCVKKEATASKKAIMMTWGQQNRDHDDLERFQSAS
jgi:hypothetical protein